ncbi:hypothetical protein GCM10010442_34310 [Kitasatospora kifunensis]
MLALGQPLHPEVLSPIRTRKMALGTSTVSRVPGADVHWSQLPGLTTKLPEWTCAVNDAAPLDLACPVAAPASQGARAGYVGKVVGGEREMADDD